MGFWASGTIAANSSTAFAASSQFFSRTALVTAVICSRTAIAAACSFSCFARTASASNLLASISSTNGSVNCIGWPIQSNLPSVPTTNEQGIPFLPAARIQVADMAPSLDLDLSSSATR